MDLVTPKAEAKCDDVQQTGLWFSSCAVPVLKGIKMYTINPQI
jgi:hypothetical protein